jgi:splicing factor U2AF subunit
LDLQFRSPEEASAAISFDGIIFQNNALKIRRPKDYLGEGAAPGGVPDSPNKIFVGGIPSYLGDEQVAELLKTFGELKSFNLVKEAGTGVSKVSLEEEEQEQEQELIGIMQHALIPGNFL